MELTEDHCPSIPNTATPCKSLGCKTIGDGDAGRWIVAYRGCCGLSWSNVVR